MRSPSHPSKNLKEHTPRPITERSGVLFFFYILTAMTADPSGPHTTVTITCTPSTISTSATG